MESNMIMLFAIWITVVMVMYKAFAYLYPFLRLAHLRLQRYLKQKEDEFFNEDNYR